jgi:copper chaperone CopZ
MTHSYHLTGMTCSSCEAKVKSSLLMLPGISSVDVSKDQQAATISMDKHIALSTLQQAIGTKYTIAPAGHHESAEKAKSWWHTYKPVLLIFIYITTASLIIEAVQQQFVWMRWMNNFMAAFFLVFSFFKLLNLQGFAESYAMYDIIAKKWNLWGFVYPFFELAIGITLLTGLYSVITNAVTLLVMLLSIVGVLQSVLNKRKIQCACLGAVFNLPMSTITIIEDALMIGMSTTMLLMY